MLAFSWGYHGWGNHTEALVELYDRVEAARGCGPPQWVDVRLRRAVRAEGFRERAFERLLGDRYTWLPGLGNRAIADPSLGRITIDRPGDIELLAALVRAAAREQRRVIFFCSCASPEGRRGCHRGEVADLLVRAAPRIAVQEWPGGAPAVAEPPLPLAARPDATRAPLPDGVDLVRAATLPHYSLVGDRVAGPAVRTARGWMLPLYETRPRAALLAAFARDRLQPFGARMPAAWRRFALTAGSTGSSRSGRT